MPQEHTVREWLESLTGFYRERAIANMESQNNSCGSRRWSSFSEALSDAFTWSRTPEGYDFWYDMQNASDPRSLLPPIPGASLPTTVIEWLCALPKGYQERALHNFNEKPDCVPSDRASSLYQAIDSAFTWSETPEGEIFWSRVCNWARGDGDLPPLPVPTRNINESEMSFLRRARSLMTSYSKRNGYSRADQRKALQSLMGERMASNQNKRPQRGPRIHTTAYGNVVAIYRAFIKVEKGLLSRARARDAIRKILFDHPKQPVLFRIGRFYMAALYQPLPLETSRYRELFDARRSIFTPPPANTKRYLGYAAIVDDWQRKGNDPLKQYVISSNPITGEGFIDSNFHVIDVASGVMIAGHNGLFSRYDRRIVRAVAENRTEEYILQSEARSCNCCGNMYHSRYPECPSNCEDERKYRVNNYHCGPSLTILTKDHPDAEGDLIGLELETTAKSGRYEGIPDVMRRYFAHVKQHLPSLKTPLKCEMDSSLLSPSCEWITAPLPSPKLHLLDSLIKDIPSVVKEWNAITGHVNKYGEVISYGSDHEDDEEYDESDGEVYHYGLHITISKPKSSIYLGDDIARHLSRATVEANYADSALLIKAGGRPLNSFCNRIEREKYCPARARSGANAIEFRFPKATLIKEEIQERIQFCRTLLELTLERMANMEEANARAKVVGHNYHKDQYLKLFQDALAA